MIDTHVHLDYESFGEEQERLVRNAEEAGVEAMITVGINLRSSQMAVKLADRFSSVYAAIGIHPNDATMMDAHAIQELRKLATHPKVVAFGETGLDYYWNKTDGAIQKKAFLQTIELAVEFNKPLIIHNRDAHDDIVQILNDALRRYPLLNGVMHCFSGGKTYLERVNNLGWYVSLAGNLTYKKSVLPELAIKVPTDRLLIETDAPFLTPVPFRGKQNEPAYLSYINQKLAETLNMNPGECAELTSHNARQLFRIKLNDKN